MCIFAGPARVSNTNIFVGRHKSRQVTVYEMEATGFSGVNAMLLPVPAARAEEVELISMEDKPDFFEKLTEATRERTRGMYLGLPTKAIPVQRVGSYDVSVATFAELRAGARFADSFKVSPAAWQTLEAYNRRGSHIPYVVLVAQLRAGEKRHPLAYSHPIYLSGGLFVPTVHEHGEGAVSWPQWDHTIFAPPGAPVHQIMGGLESRFSPPPWAADRSIGVVPPGRSRSDRP